MLQTKPKSDYNYGYINNKGNNSKKGNNIQRNELSKTGVALFVFSIILIGVLLVSYICQFVQINHLGYQISELESTLDTINDKNYTLNIKLAEKKSMAKIERFAREDLNMVEPDKVEVVVLDNNDVEKIDAVPADNEEQVFFARVLNNFMDRFGTVKAEELD